MDGGVRQLVAGRAGCGEDKAEAVEGGAAADFLPGGAEEGEGVAVEASDGTSVLWHTEGMRLSLTLLLLAGLGALGLAIPALGSAAAPPAVPLLSPLQSVGHLGVVTGRFTATGVPQDVFTVPTGYRIQVDTVWSVAGGTADLAAVREAGGATFQIANSDHYNLNQSLPCHDWVMYPGDTLVVSGYPGVETFWKVVVHQL